jgi:hypothetical protein
MYTRMVLKTLIGSTGYIRFHIMHITAYITTQESENSIFLVPKLANESEADRDQTMSHPHNLKRI